VKLISSDRHGVQTSEPALDCMTGEESLFSDTRNSLGEALEQFRVLTPAAQRRVNDPEDD
jgi:hypothetical protein